MSETEPAYGGRRCEHGARMDLANFDLLADLDARGLVHDSTDRAALAARLAEGPVSVYVGFDPTADSLHAGNLLGQVMLRRFQLAGHRPVVLAGGATGMVGDPGGRSEERNLLDRDTLAHNVACVKRQLERILDFEPGPHQARLVDNADWTAPISMLEFLRDVGKHFTVNQMVAKESVRARMESEHGISYTEFSYMLLQANDFRHLFHADGVEMQMGGSDQWGNIVAGVELIRRRHGGAAYGLTWPLLTRTDGAKMGKSVSGALWLDADKTSPYQFRQYWVQVPDDDVERFMLQLTLRPVEEVAAVAAEHRAAPERRLAQRALAHDVTALVHGEAAAQAAADAAEVLFGGDATTASAEAIAVVAREVPTSTVTESALDDLFGVLRETGLVSSNGEARRLIGQRGIKVNGNIVEPDSALSDASRLHGRYLLLQKGRTTHHLLEILSTGG
jgi:tyrosyl-tRNA synthetase